MTVQQASVAATQAARKRLKPGFVEKTLADITGGIERAVFSEENARKQGFLQRRDPRAKLLAFVALIIATGLSREWAVLAAFYALVLLAAEFSSVDMGLFVKRVWLGVGLFSAIIILPSVFFVGQRELFHFPLGLFDLAVHRDGLLAASVFVLRVGVSVSLAVLLVLTTKWADILKSLRALRAPSGLVLVLAMTYRYIFLVLHSANAMLLARKSRIVANTSGPEQRRWVVSSMGVLMDRSVRMSEEVYQAMLARGFQSEMRTIDDHRMRAADWLLLTTSVLTAAAATYVGGRL
ncbi:MAG: cobalt ECF transporter T component CbiQ [Dehalococcoidia bacterium]|jgi:cobalt/nickel transport system permease protein